MDPVTVAIEVPLLAIVVRLSVADRFGELVVIVRVTVPAKLLTLPTVTVVVAEDPWTTLR